MSVQISSAEDSRVSITIPGEDLLVLLSCLAHAKFDDEIKSYVLLSPLMNDLIREIIEFSDRNSFHESGSRWKRSITVEEANHLQGFVSKVKAVLSHDFGEKEADQLLAQAIYPNRLEKPPHNP